MKEIARTSVIILIITAALSGFLSMNKQSSFRVIAVTSRAKDHMKMMTCAKPFLEKMGVENNFTVDVTDDTSQVNDANLARYQVFVMLQEAPFDMSGPQQAALQQFIDQGKGWVGIHAAGLTGKNFVSPDVPYWQWFQDFMGGVVYSPHPAFQKGTVIVEDRTHPVTRNLPETFEISNGTSLIKVHGLMYMYWPMRMNQPINRTSLWVIIPLSGQIRSTAE